MRKIFILLFLFFIQISIYNEVFSENTIEIVTRWEWWANEEYRYSDSLEWKEMIAQQNKILKEENKYISDEETIKNLWKPDYNEKIENYLSIFSKLASASFALKSVSIFTFIFSISLSASAIETRNNSLCLIKEIYKFHAIERQWWDIWYNFLIAKDGTIFEWRAGWEKSVWAHTKRNNIWNIGISLMWDYEHEHIPEKQLESLKNLTIYLIEKYNIDINQKKYFHEDCILEKCNDDIKSKLDYPIIAHRDSSLSTCPGEIWYEDFLKYRSEIIEKYSVTNIDTTPFYKIFDRYSHKQLIHLNNLLIVKKQKEFNIQRKEIYSQIIFILKIYIDEKY